MQISRTIHICVESNHKMNFHNYMSIKSFYVHDVSIVLWVDGEIEGEYAEKVKSLVGIKRLDGDDMIGVCLKYGGVMVKFGTLCLNSIDVFRNIPLGIYVKNDKIIALVSYKDNYMYTRLVDICRVGKSITKACLYLDDTNIGILLDNKCSVYDNLMKNTVLLYISAEIEVREGSVIERVYRKIEDLFSKMYTKDNRLKIFQTIPSFKSINNLRIREQLASWEGIPHTELVRMDDEECREFIKNHFDRKYLEGYDGIYPGAFKSDIWRLCVLYKYGGLYLDAKLKLVRKDKLMYFLNKYDVCLVKDYSKIAKYSIYTVFMYFRYPRNEIILEILDTILSNIKTKNRSHCLYLTGPVLHSEIILKHMNYKNRNHIRYKELDYYYFFNKNSIRKNKGVYYMNNIKLVDAYYANKFEDLEHLSNQEHYIKLWNKNIIFMYDVTIMCILQDSESYLKYLDRTMSTIEEYYRNYRIQYRFYDNGSTDTTYRALEEFMVGRNGNIERVNERDDNICEIMNKMKTNIETEYVVIMNKDVLFGMGELDKLLQTLEDASIGMVSPFTTYSIENKRYYYLSYLTCDSVPSYGIHPIIQRGKTLTDVQSAYGGFCVMYEKYMRDCKFSMCEDSKTFMDQFTEEYRMISQKRVVINNNVKMTLK